MDEEIRQALSEVQEMKKMCGNINMKLTNIVTQRGQDRKKKLEAEYQRGLEDGKAVSDKGCEGCKYAGKVVTGPPCISCRNSYKNQWTAKDDKIEVGNEVEWRNIENNGGKGIVLWIADNSVNGRKLCDIMSASGSAGTWYTDEVVKTGRHFAIASILEDLRK